MVDVDIRTLKDLAIRVDALRRAMEAVMNGTTPDHGKWSAFRSYARTYCSFAEQYMRLTNDHSLQMYNVTSMRSSSDTAWPIQKEIFDIIYANTLLLSDLLSQYNRDEVASISAIQDLLSANLRRAIFTRPERELDIQNAIEALLIGMGYQKPLHYEHEAGKIEFSGKEFIHDFIFPSFLWH